METIYEFKKLNYHTTLYKDYCEITESDLNSLKTFPLDGGPFFFDLRKVKEHYDYESKSSHYDEETYKENLKNVLASTKLDKITFVICKDENKTSLKFFTYSLEKNVGKKFFIKRTNCDYITYNHKTHTLYTGSVLNYHKKKGCLKAIRKNNWFEGKIKQLSQRISAILKHNNRSTNNFDSLYEQQKKVNKCFDLFFSNIPGINYETKNPDQRIYERFLIGQKIKYPNNWSVFQNVYPNIKLKDLRKHKMKLIDTYMSINKLNGDKIKRVLHLVNSIEGINLLKFSFSLFGNDFILSKSDEILKKIIETSMKIDFFSLTNIFLHLNNFTKNEIKNCFEIFQLILKGEINCTTFIDHIITKNRLNMIEPVMWRAFNYDMFINEHYEWAEKLGTHTNIEYNRYYNSDFKEIIEQPIDEYTPVLLTNTKEYNMESFFQHNCVRTYNNKPDSLIISLRNSIDGGRATIEYKIKGDYDNIKLVRVQTLGRYNQRLDDNWTEPLKKLDLRVEETLKNDIFTLPQIEIKQGSNCYITNLKFVDVFEYPLVAGQRGNINTEKTLIFEKNITKENILTVEI